MSENGSCAIVLAGGQGKRMKSDLPKPMFEVLGVPMIDWVLDACKDSGIDDICVVTGFNHEVLEAHLNGVHTVLQEERKGTGHAVMMCREWLSERAGKDVIDGATLSYVEGYASSACEMVAEIVQYTGENIRLRPEEADAIYGGIVVDTDGFVKNAGVRTFEAAAFLRRSGADVVRVRKLFREEAVEYKARADAVSQAEIYRDAFAISVCNGEGLRSPTVVGAQAANEMLNIDGIKASFVMTEYNGLVFVSARSIDEVNVQLVMEHMGGGGHINMAGSQMSNATVEEAIARVKEVIDQMIEDGEIEI